MCISIVFVNLFHKTSCFRLTRLKASRTQLRDEARVGTVEPLHNAVFGMKIFGRAEKPRYTGVPRYKGDPMNYVITQKSWHDKRF